MIWGFWSKKFRKKTNLNENYKKYNNILLFRLMFSVGEKLTTQFLFYFDLCVRKYLSFWTIFQYIPVILYLIDTYASISMIIVDFCFLNVLLMFTIFRKNELRCIVYVSKILFSSNFRSPKVVQRLFVNWIYLLVYIWK